MTGTICLRGATYECQVREQDNELHDAADSQNVGIVHFAEHRVVIADKPDIDEMRQVVLHELLHVILRENLAVTIALRPNITEDNRERFIDTLATELRDAIRDSDWRDACGASLMPVYMGDGAGQGNDGP